MNPNEAVRLSLSAGEVMLSNGAETYRVEEVMRRIMSSCGFMNSEAFVVSTGLFICVNTDNGDISSFKRIIKRTMNVDALIKMNEISRAFGEGRLTPDAVMSGIEEIRTGQGSGNGFTKLFSAATAVGCFCYLFGGSLTDCLNAFFTGFILQILLIQLRKNRISEVLVNIIGGIMITFLVLTLMNLGVGLTYNYIIIGALMIMVPGMALTNAVRDILGGDYLSGTVRLMDALLVAIALATGVGTALSLWYHIFGGVYI